MEADVANSRPSLRAIVAKNWQVSLPTRMPAHFRVRGIMPDSRDRGHGTVRRRSISLTRNGSIHSMRLGRVKSKSVCSIEIETLLISSHFFTLFSFAFFNKQRTLVCMCCKFLFLKIMNIYCLLFINEHFFLQVEI